MKTLLMFPVKNGIKLMSSFDTLVADERLLKSGRASPGAVLLTLGNKSQRSTRTEQQLQDHRREMMPGNGSKGPTVGSRAKPAVMRRAHEE